MTNLARFQPIGACWIGVSHAHTAKQVRATLTYQEMLSVFCCSALTCSPPEYCVASPDKETHLAKDAASLPGSQHY